MASTNSSPTSFRTRKHARPRSPSGRRPGKVFDANSLVVLRKASVRFDAEKDMGKIRAKVLYVLSRTDKVFPPSIAPDVIAKLKAAGATADYFEIDSDFGHSASGLDADKWAPRLKAFMATLEKRS